MMPAKRTMLVESTFLPEEYLHPLGVSQKGFAEHIGVPIQRVNEVVRGRRSVSSETAWLFAEALGTTPEFWMNLPAQQDLARSKPKRTVRWLGKSA
jgi:addiction module HigA family antidote